MGGLRPFDLPCTPYSDARPKLGLGCAHASSPLSTCLDLISGKPKQMPHFRLFGSQMRHPRISSGEHCQGCADVCSLPAPAQRAAVQNLLRGVGSRATRPRPSRSRRAAQDRAVRARQAEPRQVPQPAVPPPGDLFLFFPVARCRFLGWPMQRPNCRNRLLPLLAPDQNRPPPPALLQRQRDSDAGAEGFQVYGLCSPHGGATQQIPGEDSALDQVHVQDGVLMMWALLFFGS